jgi:hypothetical protein
MSTDKATVLQRIKHTFNTEAKIPNNLRLPSDIEFEIRGNSVEMRLSAIAVGKNMQEDKASFEGWALVLIRWGKFDKVFLSWNRPSFDPESSAEAHYQRFLFRVDNFSWDFSSWFSVSAGCLKYLTDLKINDASNYYLSPPYNERDKKDVKGTESILEYHFSLGDWKDALKSITNADYLNRQLPVGVFNKPVSNKTRLLPKNKSAIDIWGISKTNDLLIFELKAKGNIKIGIITELYFYCCVMQRIQKGQFKYEKYDVPYLDRIAKTVKINAYLLSPELHPLIDKELVGQINLYTLPSMGFHYLRFPSEDGSQVRLMF